MDSPAAKYVKTEFRFLDGAVLLSTPVTALLGVSTSISGPLKQFSIESIFDLASSALFGGARRIVEAAEDPNSTAARAGTVPLDVIDAAAQAIPIRELQLEPISRLRGVTAPAASDIATELSVTTIRDLALWPPYWAARSIVNIALGGTEPMADSERPLELLPQMGRYPTERLQYEVILLDKLLEPAPHLTHHLLGSERRVVAVQIQEEGIPLENAGQIDLSTAISPDAGFQKPAVGALLTFTQSWYTLGLSLGHLLHALPLAPGESTRIAVVDWNRRSSAKTSESVSQSDALESSLAHARSISEVTSAVAHELQTGEATSVGAGTSLSLGEGGGAAGGGEYGMFKGAATGGHSTGFSAGAGFAKSWASSAGTRDIAAEMTQKIVDSTHQASSMVRNRRASAIREISQSEHEVLSTRSVTNFNHMHAMTVQYYEVVQVYKTVNELTRVTRCLFVPMRPIDFSLRAVAARFRNAIATGALNSEVRAAVLSKPNSVILVPSRQSQPWDQNQLDALQSLFGGLVGSRVSSEVVFPRSIQPWGFGFGVSGDPTNTADFPFDSVIFEIEGAPTQTVAITDLGATGTSDLGRKFVDCRQAFGAGDSAKDFWNIRSVRLHRKSGRETFSGEIYVLVMVHPFGSPPAPGQGSKGWLTLCLPVAAGESSVPVYTIVRTASDSSLTRHLIDNSLYYSQLVWRSLDSATLGLLLSPYTLQGRPLLELIDPLPMAVAGNYLVFRTYVEDDSWIQFLASKKLKVGSVRESVVALPSSGVFAEAVLGRSNSAERLDISRFWNWQDSPIPIQAPEISALQAGSRSQPEPLQASELGAPTISIVDPQKLPDPQGMAAILAAIQNGNMFRDMSGLGATVGFAQAAMARAFDAARDAAAQAGENAKTAADVLKTMYSKGAATSSDSVGGAKTGGGAQQTNGTSELSATPSNLGALVNAGKSLDERQTQRSSGSDPASEWAQWPGSGGPELSSPPLVSTENESAMLYGSRTKPKTGSSAPSSVNGRFERVVQFSVLNENSNIVVPGEYQFEIQEAVSGVGVTMFFTISSGSRIGVARLSIPAGTWNIGGLVRIAVPENVVNIPVTVLPGLDPITFNAQRTQLQDGQVYNLSHVIEVPENTKVINLVLRPVFQDITVEREIQLSASATGMAQFNTEVRAGIEGKGTIGVAEVTASGSTAVGASYSLSGTLGASQTLKLRMVFKIVKELAFDKSK